MMMMMKIEQSCISHLLNVNHNQSWQIVLILIMILSL